MSFLYKNELIQNTFLAKKTMLSSYNIKTSKPFIENTISQNQIKQALDFAYSMVYADGHHRAYRSGGSITRKKGEQFCNTFQGKLAEIVLYDFLRINHSDIKVSEPDFSIMGKGLWDDTDLKINDKFNISIKSMAFFSNLLLLETKDWDQQGAYIPNLSTGNNALYDYFIIVRLKEDIKQLFKHEKLLYSNENLDKNKIEKIILSKNWYFDVPGCASLKTIIHLIENKNILVKGAILNNRTPMDAENYFCEVSKLHPLEKMIAQIKKAP
ncbi:hypothetical protein [Myroides pelagicus]|uniref:Uncharacterized protein n=1 Tax=Myroides pelagicus TaxID=270914 RepID=A0A7K1GPW6_9FLAO|nr:hypothetical protein [Myroides pelagicus]MTH30818.1 hypothetical protein [Myroides pelagicus]